MKRAGIILTSICLLVSLSAHADADGAVAPANPYLAISDRNVFALVPIPVVSSVPEAAPKDPPPKITPNGIISLFGQMQVLFKVAVPAKAGQPAKDDAFMLAAGERQNDIEVVSIDQERAIIKFINHGVPQELPLQDAPKLTGPAAGSGGGAGGGMVGGVPPPPSGGLNPTAAARLARAAGGKSSAAGTDTGSPTLATGPSDKQIYNPSSETVTDPEVATARMAKNYLETKAKDPAKAALFPLSTADKKALEEALGQ